MAVTAIGGIGLAMGVVETGVALAAPSTVYVSTTAKATHADTSCATAKFTSIQAAIKAVAAHGLVIVCKGTYTLTNQGVAPGKPLVRVNRQIRVHGESAVLDASGSTAGTGAGIGILVTASNSTVSGFRVTGAVNEGIAVEPIGAFRAGPTETPATPLAPITGVTIRNNAVVHNNRGFAADFCQGPKDYPDDCGGGIHFNAVAHSTMAGNRVARNADGILVTDDAGPTHDNVIRGNRVVNNTIECGITLPSHSSKAASVKQNADGSLKVTALNPGKGGVYNNVVENNVSTGNGTHGFEGFGSGAGVLLAGGGPGTAVYRNVVRNNTLSGNGLAGVTVHAHYPGGEFLGGNRIVDNTIGKNNLLGDGLDSPITAVDRPTTGIILFTAPKTTFVVDGNVISNDTRGIWRNAAVTIKGSNTFHSVSHRIVTPRSPFASGACGLNSFFGPCSVTSSTATVLGLIVANGNWTAYYVKYGTSPGALNTNTAANGAGSKVTPVGVRVTLTGLTANTTYYYRLVAINSAGKRSGFLLSFKTSA